MKKKAQKIMGVLVYPTFAERKVTLKTDDTITIKGVEFLVVFNNPFNKSEFQLHPKQYSAKIEMMSGEFLTATHSKPKICKALVNGRTKRT